MHARSRLGYVVEINGNDVVCNLHDTFRGQVGSVQGDLVSIAQPGDWVGALSGNNVVVMQVMSVYFSEHREAHRRGVGTAVVIGQPLRLLRARVVGFMRRSDDKIDFVPENWVFPALGAEVVPLTLDELSVILQRGESPRYRVRLGVEARTRVPVEVNVNELLTRHVAVLGGTGYGKTNFVARLVQELLNRSRGGRVVILDINGEYASAFAYLKPKVKITVVGGEGFDTQHTLRIPYYSLGRPGLMRLLLPSERTQAPALRFAIEHLEFVEFDDETNGAFPANDAKRRGVLFDDCRNDGAQEAYEALQRIRSRQVGRANVWPPMRALSCLAAEWAALQKRGRNGSPERQVNLYNNVVTMINRIRALIEDERFVSVIDVDGGAQIEGENGWQSAGSKLVERIFGPAEDTVQWKIHIVDLSRVTQDHAPFILGALLELYAHELFRRGPDGTYPTLLVLEEAHHYLRQLRAEWDSSQTGLAYERLTKEGRKFGVSLIVSTQRPAELSPTVLAQCGTWFVFRLTNEEDRRAVSYAAESSGQDVLRQIPGLPRGHAVAFGAAFPIPCRIEVARPPEGRRPRSDDPGIAEKWGYGVEEAKRPSRRRKWEWTE